jgi:hypothetical protein
VLNLRRCLEDWERPLDGRVVPEVESNAASTRRRETSRGLEQTASVFSEDIALLLHQRFAGKSYAKFISTCAGDKFVSTVIVGIRTDNRKTHRWTNWGGHSTSRDFASVARSLPF